VNYFLCLHWFSLIDVKLIDVKSIGMFFFGCFKFFGLHQLGNNILDIQGGARSPYCRILKTWEKGHYNLV
jgi:hypothetical protein